MNKDLNRFLKDICKSQSRSIVGKLCKRIEILEDQELSSNQKLNVLKSFCKELVYEEFRTLRNSVVFYNEGREYNQLSIYNPTKDK